MNNQIFTTCKNCKNFLNTSTNLLSDEWYNHLCKVSPLPTKRDPYDGELKPYRHNDLGTEYFSDDKYQYCREINKNGNCKNFEEKKKGLVGRFVQK